MITNGIPIGIFFEGMTLLKSLEGMGPSAIKLFGTMAGAFVLLAFKSKKWTNNIYRYPFQLLFFFFCFLSIFWASSFVFSLRMIVKLLSPFIILLTAHLVMSENRKMGSMENAIFTGLLILLLTALINHFAGFSGDHMSQHWRAKNMLTSPSSSPAPFSFSMACGAMLALASYLTERRKWYLFLFIAFSIAVFWAFTRISMAGLIIASSILIFFLARSVILKVLLPILLCLGITVAFFTVDLLKERGFRNPSTVSLSKFMENPAKVAKNIHTSGRAELWADGLKRFFYPSPLIGSGMGATQEFYYGRGQEGRGVIHSEYLRLLCEVGIIGLFLFVLAMLHYLAMLMIVFRRSAKDNSDEARFKRKYSCLAIAGLIFYLVTMATDNTIDYVMNLGLYVFFFIGFALTKSKNQNPQSTG